MEEFKEDVAMPIEGFGDALIRKSIEEGRKIGKREITIEVIWNLHEMGVTDEKISKAVDQPIDYVQEVLKKNDHRKKRNKLFVVKHKKVSQSHQNDDGAALFWINHKNKSRLSSP